MFTATPLLCTKGGSGALDTLLLPIDKSRFRSGVRRLHTLFRVYACTSPEPLPAPGLIVTPEIRTQCERYLPLADITSLFNHLYAATLSYPPILSSTPFHNALSWADCFEALPAQFQFSSNPAQLMEALLDDRHLLTRFVFASFLPARFYGGIGRYPVQRQFVTKWLVTRENVTLRCLDAACGTGEGIYALALMLSEHRLSPDQITLDGWTLEPLEVWAATNRCFPHDERRQALMNGTTSALFQRGYENCISFYCRDILQPSPQENGGSECSENGCYDLILCNGLLGGPIIHLKELLNRAVANLAEMLAPGGILLAADSFHGGWKQKCPQMELRALFETNGLSFVETGEGIGGLKPY